MSTFLAERGQHLFEIDSTHIFDLITMIIFPFRMLQFRNVMKEKYLMYTGLVLIDIWYE